MSPVQLRSPSKSVYPLVIYLQVYMLMPLYTPVIIVLIPVAGMDYGAVIDEILRFSACQRKQCVRIPILEDSVPEGVKYFNVTLERTPGLDPRITLNPVDGLICIIDGMLLLIISPPSFSCILKPI